MKLGVRHAAEKEPKFMISKEGLRADCGRCFGYCCVVPALTASADFAIDKAAGRPCPHLATDFRCAIHDRLRPEGFPGCAAYDCFGAGQQVAQVTFGGRDWRQTPQQAASMFAAFTVMRQLHELLWYLTEALEWAPDAPLRASLRRAYEQTERHTTRRPEELTALDVAGLRREVGVLLRQASEAVRSSAGPIGPDHSNADLVGAELSRAQLSRACLRGAYLVGADLTAADLSHADLLGTDLRGADLSGADLTASVFLTQAQLDSARGDAHTRLPPALTRPAHWAAG
jgi:uncharacterized protein YjbI with pentapeptide repeats